MLKNKLTDDPRQFQLAGYELSDFGAIQLCPAPGKNHAIVSIETENGKKNDVVATQWGLYLGGSVNDRLVREGFRVALMLNPGNQLYVVAVDQDKIEIFEKYVDENKARVLCWLDTWCSSHEVFSPHVNALEEKK